MAARAAKKSTKDKIIKIQEPNFKVLEVPIVGTADYVSNRFSGRKVKGIADKQAEGDAGETARGKRPPKDFELEYQESLHISSDGKHYGFPCGALRAAMVRAGFVVGVDMTMSKVCVFVLGDFSERDGTQCVKFIKGRPEKFIADVRNDGGGSMDVRSRGKFAPGWKANVRIRYDADLFTAQTVANILARAGISVGIGAGRPFSVKSCGMGWGTFEIEKTQQ